jgi:hypothetical protein
MEMLASLSSGNRESHGEESWMLELSRKIDCRAITVRELIISGEVGIEDDSELRERESCFAEVYADEAEALCVAILDAARREESWGGAVGAGLRTLLEFAAERPMVANALFREVYAVGGPALVKREEVVNRLTAALEGNCDEPDDEVVVPRPARFIVGAVEGVIAGHLSRGDSRRLPRIAPELTRFVVAAFRGLEAAAGELSADA